MGLAFKYWNEGVDTPETFRTRGEQYRAGLAQMDFRGVPDLPRYFGYDTFNDGTFERFDYDARTSALTIEMESWAIMNEVLDQREGQGLYGGDRSHRCEDFFYTCRFSRVAHFAYTRPLTVWQDEEEPSHVRIARWQHHDDYQCGEIQESELVRELRDYYHIPLFHLCIETGNGGTLDIVFGHVKVRKSNDVPFSDYVGGKPIRLKCLYRWKRQGSNAH